MECRPTIEGSESAQKDPKIPKNMQKMPLKLDSEELEVY